MIKNVILSHVAVECSSQHHADLFFSGVLGLQKVKSTLLSKELSEAIFHINHEVRFDLYVQGHTRFEVFINEGHHETSYDHICIEVDDTDGFIFRCKEQGLEPFFIEKEGKKLLFVRDFSANLYEIK
ncbi:MAG: hypothetical protein JW840_09050 [Candidatus Thermoplasmatota archaeon]|nr:hypothetical protein [Candidatus Thermoplasmatota archaeon]